MRLLFFFFFFFVYLLFGKAIFVFPVVRENLLFYNMLWVRSVFQVCGTLGIYRAPLGQVMSQNAPVFSSPLSITLLRLRRWNVICHVFLLNFVGCLKVFFCYLVWETFALWSWFLVLLFIFWLEPPAAQTKYSTRDERKNGESDSSLQGDSELRVLQPRLDEPRLRLRRSVWSHVSDNH